MLPEDNSFNWGAVLLRLLPWEQTQRKDLVMSVLRALAYNPSIAVDAPKWQPKVDTQSGNYYISLRLQYQPYHRLRLLV